MKYYYTMYVGGLSGVGFDTKAEIEEREWVFRTLDLSAFITSMDAVHMTYDRAPFPARHVFIGKEGYPTVAFTCTRMLWDGSSTSALSFQALTTTKRPSALITWCRPCATTP